MNRVVCEISVFAMSACGMDVPLQDSAGSREQQFRQAAGHLKRCRQSRRDRCHPDPANGYFNVSQFRTLAR